MVSDSPRGCEPQQSCSSSRTELHSVLMRAKMRQADQAAFWRARHARDAAWRTRMVLKKGGNRMD